MDGMGGHDSGPTPEDCFFSLLGMAEYFRTSQPPRYRLTIHYLTVATRLSVSSQLQALAHFHLGKMLHHHTLNDQMAQQHLEQTYILCQNFPIYADLRVQTASYLAEIYSVRESGEKVIAILRNELDNAHDSFWKCRFLFQLAEAYLKSKNITAARQFLQYGAQFCIEMNIPYTQCLFRLSEGLLVLHDRSHMDDLRPILETVGNILPTIHNVTGYRHEALKAFFLFLQVCYMLMQGLMNLVTPALTELQQCVTAAAQAPAASDDAIGGLDRQFEWLTRDLLTTLTFTVTAIHAMHHGHIDRVHRYVERAIGYVDRVACRITNSSSVDSNMNTLLTSIRLLLLEHSVQSHLVAARPTPAIQEITMMAEQLQRVPTLFANHEAQLHTLLGLYALQVRQTDAAELHFQNSLRTCRDMDLWTYVNLNLALFYLYERRDHDFYALLERITPERLQTQSTHLKAAANFVRGLQSFMQSRAQDAKRYLKDCLALANKEQIVRMSAMSLVLLAHMYLRTHDVQESSTMLNHAMDVLQKMPDLQLHIWASELLKDIYRMCSQPDKAAESERCITVYTQRWQQRHQRALQTPQHQVLCSWYDGDIPALPPAQLAGE